MRDWFALDLPLGTFVLGYFQQLSAVPSGLVPAHPEGWFCFQQGQIAGRNDRIWTSLTFRRPFGAKLGNDRFQSHTQIGATDEGGYPFERTNAFYVN
jgi:hypothetical protein